MDIDLAFERIHASASQPILPKWDDSKSAEVLSHFQSNDMKTVFGIVSCMLLGADASHPDQQRELPRPRKLEEGHTFRTHKPPLGTPIFSLYVSSASELTHLVLKVSLKKRCSLGVVGAYHDL